jgi:hypothetical protein
MDRAAQQYGVVARRRDSPRLSRVNQLGLVARRRRVRLAAHGLSVLSLARFRLAALRVVMLGGLVSAALLGVTSEVTAQACCAGTGSGEVGLVGPCHDGGLTTSLTYTRALASYDSEGAMHGTDASLDDLVLALSGGVRFADRRLLLAVAAPVRLQHRRYGDERSTRVGLGDAAVSLRAMAVRGSMRGFERGDAESYVPFVDLFATLGTPTGRAADDAKDRLGADVAGTGAFSLAIGTRITSFLTLQHSLSLTLGWRHAFARDVEVNEGPARRIALGEIFDARLSWSYVPSLFTVGGGFVGFSWNGTTEQDGAAVPHSRGHRTTVGAFYSRYLRFPTVELTVVAAIDALFPHASANAAQVGPSVSIAISRWFHRAWRE